VKELLWLTLPYIAFTSFVVGHVWRYRHDQFGWTTRSSQIYESKMLRWGGPLFHFGLLAVLGGHVMGLGVPASWTAAVGITESEYHLVSVTMGTLAGGATVAGLAILLYRRFTVPSVRKATSRMDKLMYVLLVSVICTGMANTIGANLIGGGYDYRSTVAPWFRSLFTVAPQPELMVGIPLSYQLHAVIVLLLIGLWPYTRLVHVFSAPVGYVTRPYVVYRSRGDASPGVGGRRYAKAWEHPYAKAR
jgi:nitrate reductase gamma subunit